MSVPHDKRLTAAAIKTAKNLPPRLLAIGREIEAKASRADTYHTKASDMIDSIKALLVEAKRYCDRSGFDAFRTRFCPSLGRSRAYKLLAIASGKKSAEQVRATATARQGRHIAKLRAAAAELKRPSLTDSGKLQSITPSLVPLIPGDNVQRFTAWVLELVLLTASAEPTTFTSAAIEADDLRKLAAFLLIVADSQKPKLRIVR
jgi:hypothetical protein